MGFSLRFYYPQLFSILDAQPSATRQAHGGEQALCGVESFSFPLASSPLRLRGPRRARGRAAKSKELSPLLQLLKPNATLAMASGLCCLSRRSYGFEV